MVLCVVCSIALVGGASGVAHPEPWGPLENSEDTRCEQRMKMEVSVSIGILEMLLWTIGRTEPVDLKSKRWMSRSHHEQPRLYMNLSTKYVGQLWRCLLVELQLRDILKP
jgi:hypothetical protein